jgi:photosystem II stability/assembly factor-like uncharacterized protein
VIGDDKSLWAVGDEGTILHSSDGQRWDPQMSGTNQTLYSVFGSIDGKALWAVGDRGTILHSGDGEHWDRQALKNSVQSLGSTVLPDR